MSKLAHAVLLASGLGLAACGTTDLTVPNYNSPDAVNAAKNPAAVQFAATGIAATLRDGANGRTRDFGIVGREIFYFQAQDGRWTTGYLNNWVQNTSFFAGTAYGGPFGNRRNIFNFANIVDSATALSAAQKSAAKGFAYTIDALEELYVIQARGTIGAPVDVYADPSQIAPFVSQDSVYKYISARLDQALTLLQAGSAAFPFTLPSGYAGFNTPTTFGYFNRLIKARVEAYRGSLGCAGAAPATCYTAALTALNSIPTSVLPAVGTAISSTALQTGVYNTYSTAAGDATLAISSAGAPFIRAHPTILTDAGINPADPRITANTTTSTALSQAGSITSAVGVTKYPSLTSSLPVFKIEEAVLLRAEANFFTGATGPAATDINTIRTAYGQPTVGPFAAAPGGTSAFLDELLLQRRLSLFFEGHRWVDMRRFGRLSTLPASGTGFTVADRSVVPSAECLIRQRQGDTSLPANSGC